MSRVKIRELRLRNYRAVANARLILDDVTFLVGRNGAGKSTLLDAAGFIAEALTDSLRTALERRGSLRGIRRRLPGNLSARSDVSLAVVFDVEDVGRVLYGFTLGRGLGAGTFAVKAETIRGGTGQMDNFARPAGDDSRSENILRDETIQTYLNFIDPETLAFPLIAGSNRIWPSILMALREVSIHQFVPRTIQEEPRIGNESRLNRNGSNAGDVLKNSTPEDKRWIEQRLAAVVPGVLKVNSSTRVGRRVIVFDQEGTEGRTNQFEASMMSEGTVRSLAVLLALRQSPRPSGVLVDEIEDSLHPFAQSVLLDAIEAASLEFPVVVTTHNPEILSHPSASPDRIRVIQWEKGMSQIYHLSDEVTSTLQPPETVGRLLRANALWTADQPSVCGEGDAFFEI